MSHDDYPELPKVHRTKERPYGFIDDAVDIARHLAMWKYDDIRAEPLPHWSDKRMLGVNLCNLIPFGRWTAHGKTGQASQVARGATSALSFRPPGEGVEMWRVRWHRIRLNNGNSKSRERGESADPYGRSNLMFKAEGGTLAYGAASQLCRYSPEALRARAIAAGLMEA